MKPESQMPMRIHTHSEKLEKLASKVASTNLPSDQQETILKELSQLYADMVAISEKDVVKLKAEFDSTQQQALADKCKQKLERIENIEASLEETSVYRRLQIRLNNITILFGTSILSTTQWDDIFTKFREYCDACAELSNSLIPLNNTATNKKESIQAELDLKSIKAKALEDLLTQSHSLDTLQVFLENFDYQTPAMQGKSSDTAALFDKLSKHYHALVQPTGPKLLGSSKHGFWRSPSKPTEPKAAVALAANVLFNERDQVLIQKYYDDLLGQSGKKPTKKREKVLELQGITTAPALHALIEVLRVSDPDGVLEGNPSRFKQLLERLEFNYLLHPHPYFECEELQAIDTHIVIWRQEILRIGKPCDDSKLKADKIMALEELRQVDCDPKFEIYLSKHRLPDSPLMQGDYSKRGKTLLDDLETKHPKVASNPDTLGRKASK